MSQDPRKNAPKSLPSLREITRVQGIAEALGVMRGTVHHHQSEAGTALSERRVNGALRHVHVRLLGMPVVALSRTQVVDYISSALERGRGGWVITANVDYFKRYCSDVRVRRLFSEADLVTADGIPLLWAARLQGRPLPDRVAGSDLVWLLAERAAKDGRSLYLLGGNAGVAEAAAVQFSRRWPELRIAGISSPWISPEPTMRELEELRRGIEEAQPDLVFVAFGAPKEERVISTLRRWFPRTWFLGAGIGLSFAAGDIRRAPAWAQRCGLEWAHRLLQEPRRLAGRYLVKDLPFAIGLLLRARWRRKDSPIVDLH